MDKNLTLPNVVIAGAPKCGTSSLFFWLASHPDVCGSKVKETFYLTDQDNRFNGGNTYEKNGLENYSRFFNHHESEKIIIEATAPYIYYNTPIKVLSGLKPKPKVVFIFREPAARIYSQYKFNKYKLKNFSGSFSEYIQEKDGYFSGRLINEGKYGFWLEKWMEKFDQKDLLVFSFEEMVSDQKTFMQKFSRRLNIDPDFYDSFSFFKRNETFGVKSTGLHRFGLKIQQFVPYKMQEILLPFYQKINGTAIPKITQEEKEIVARLKKWYHQENQNLYALFPDLGLEDLWK